MVEGALPISYVAILRALVNELGGDGDVLLAGTDLTPADLAQPGGLCPVSLLRRLYLRARDITAEPALGLHYGSHLPLTAHGVLGYALLSCRSVGQALDILMKYYRLLLGGAVLEHRVSGERLVIGYRAAGSALVDRQFDQEVFYAGLVAALTQLLHRPLSDARFRFSYPAPAHRATYVRLLGDQLSFDDSEDAIELPLSLLELTPEFANPAMLQLYQQQCEQMLGQMEARDGLAGQLRRYLLSAQGRFPSLAETAAHFHQSTRSLRRHLAQEQSSFQAVRDEVRMELAERYLRDPALSVAQVAELLQFSDLSNFRRAFLRWTGQSPAQYRRRAGGGRQEA